MKYFLLLILFFSIPIQAQEKKETKVICVAMQDKQGKPIIDPKTSKPKQDCKEVKKHKKYNGTKIDDVKK